MSNIVFGRTKVRRVLQTTLAVALVGGVVSTLDSPAVAAPEKVLQSVAISLGSDSSIQEIESTTVRAGEDEELSSDSESLDPATVSGDLPVRVLTSYRLGDRTGTDLADIEGESGRVVVDVTVQNVTARPETITYDFDGAQRKQNALVATPMTVVASADLGEDGIGTVVTENDLDADDVTNGVLGRSEGRSTDVQWAALLAPPRLGSSATFRLVQDTESFVVPSFDLSVQPGLVTDPSVEQLLEAAFSEDPSSTLKLETSTIELVSSVNGILTTASSVLGQIQTELGTSAEVLGQKTIADLESSASLVSSSLSSLAGDIDALSSQTSSEMERASADTVAQFEETVGRMQSLLGDPREFENLPSVKPIGCGDDITRLRTDASITEQMIAITSQLRSIQTATEDCKAVITAGLDAAIGTTEDTSGTPTVLGSLAGTQQLLSDEAASLNTQAQDLAEQLDGDLLGYLTTSVGSLGTLVERIQAASGEIKGGNGNKSLVKLLEDTQTVLGGLQTTLAAPDAGLRDVFSDVNATATTQIGQLEELTSQVDAVRGAAEDMCREAGLVNPGNDVVDSGGFHDISNTLVGTDCDGEVVDVENAVVTQLGLTDQRVSEALTALQSIRTLSDTTNGPAAQAMQSVTSQVDSANAIIDDILESDGESVKNSITLLLGAIGQLSDGVEPNFGPEGPQWPTDLAFSVDESPNADQRCAVVTSFTLPAEITDPALQPNGYQYPDPLEQLRLFHKKMQCNQFGIDTQIISAFAVGEEILGNASEALEGQRTQIDAVRDEANTRVGEVVDQLSAALDTSVDSIKTEGKATIQRQRERLETEETKLAAGLDQRITEAVRRIQGTVSESNRNLVASERALKSDLNEVLLDLGTRDEEGSGLLGALAKGASDTGTATANVVRANQATSEFAGVRSTALADVFLQQAQLERSFGMLERYPAFGIELPAGSSHLTVFTFAIGGN